jgi:hypothetical protein
LIRGVHGGERVHRVPAREAEALGGEERHLRVVRNVNETVVAPQQACRRRLAEGAMDGRAARDELDGIPERVADRARGDAEDGSFAQHSIL